MPAGKKLGRCTRSKYHNAEFATLYFTAHGQLWVCSWSGWQSDSVKWKHMNLVNLTTQTYTKKTHREGFWMLPTCTCVFLSIVCLHCADIPCPVVSPLCAWVAVASSRRASWRWCLQVSGVQQVLLWWCHRVASRGRLPGCSQVASSLAGRPWWDELTLGGPENTLINNNT